MSRFTGPLTITEASLDDRLWRLETPLVYEVGTEGSGREIMVPVGFTTDGASVPRMFWFLLPTWGRYSRAAVVHDILLVRLAANDPHPEATSRADADAVFLEAMGVLGVNLLVRYLMWAAVRLWGIMKWAEALR